LGLKYANIENFEWFVSFGAILKATNGKTRTRIYISG
jgi:hypothetical protein